MLNASWKIQVKIWTEEIRDNTNSNVVFIRAEDITMAHFEDKSRKYLDPGTSRK